MMYNQVEHTADLAYEIEYQNESELFEDIVNIIRENVEGEETEESKERIFEFGGDLEDFIFDFANELIFEVETGWLPKHAEFDGRNVKVVFNRLKRLDKFDLKAMTYHMSRIEGEGGKNTMRVVFDV